MEFNAELKTSNREPEIKGKIKSLIRLFFLIMGGFIAARTIRWRTALWEGDSLFGYELQKYELLCCGADTDK